MKRILLGVALMALAACATVGGTPRESAADTRLRQIYETEWDWRQLSEPDDSDTPNDEKAPLDWGKVDAATQEERLAYMQDVIRQLDALDAKLLSPEAQINLAIYRDQIETRISRLKFREYEKPLNADTTFWTLVASSAPNAFRTEAQARAYISRLNDTPRYFAENIANMKLGLARGFTPPRVTLEGRDASISTIYEGKTAEQSAFYEPFMSLPASIPAETRADLQAAAKTAIETKVFRAYRELLPFFRDEYFPRTATELAATKLPDGEAYYAAQIREFTTLTKSPDEIHQIGLAGSREDQGAHARGDEGGKFHRRHARPS